MVDKRLLPVFTSPFYQISWSLSTSGLLDCWAPWRQEGPLAQTPGGSGGLARMTWQSLEAQPGAEQMRTKERDPSSRHWVHPWGQAGTWAWVNRAHSQAGQGSRQLETSPAAWLLFRHYQVGHGSSVVTKLLAPCEPSSCVIGAQVQWSQSRLQKDHSCVIVL